MKLSLETLSELPARRTTRKEVERTLKAIGGDGNYLHSKHLAIRSYPMYLAKDETTNKWRQL